MNIKKFTGLLKNNWIKIYMDGYTKYTITEFNFQHFSQFLNTFCLK